jgi:hypothetical protein
MKKIILTGGGTAGHVTPNIALLPSLKEAGYEVFYIGSYTGIEKTLIENLDIPYYGISSGKLRRYKSFKNLTDPFRVIKGYFQARRLMRRIKPDIIFSKGGFVSVPVVLAAGHKHIPVIIHESDMTPGLANRIAIKKATKVCCNFPETIKYLPADKAVGKLWVKQWLTLDVKIYIIRIRMYFIKYMSEIFNRHKMCRAFGFLTERAFQITGTCYFYIYSFEAFNISHKLLIGNILLECSCKLVRTGCWLKAAFNSFHTFDSFINVHTLNECGNTLGITRTATLKLNASNFIIHYIEFNRT